MKDLNETQFRVNETVRLIKYPESHMNSLAKVESIYDDGSIWIVNLNMPFAGTISKIYTPKMIKKEIRKFQPLK
jgi:hypothetical protein